MYLILIVILCIIVCVLAIGLNEKKTNAICCSKKRLEGKTAIVTGGTSGMGLQIATDLADRGAHVIIACPFEDEGTAAKRLIEEETENEQVIFKLLDLSSFVSVRKFAADIISNEDRVDILINNAGVGLMGDRMTEDGINIVLQINYYGHFLLTLLLLPLLKITGSSLEPARIVNISSVLHYLGRVNLHYFKNFKLLQALQLYSDSKFFLMLFASDLSRKLEGSNVVINCVDPGAVGTGIFKGLGTIWAFIIEWSFFTFFKTPWEGAQTALHVALDKKAGTVSGQIFTNCKLSYAKRSAYSEENAEWLWAESLKLVRLGEEELQLCLKT